MRPPDAGFAIALPGRPQVETRELDFDGGKVSMTMASAGVGRTLFAAGAAPLPAAALAPERLEATVGWFRDALLRNVSATDSRSQTAPALRGVQTRAALAVAAAGRPGKDGRSVQLAARFYVADDRLYQVVAFGAEDEIPPQALETFFDSFRLVR
ncbi:MAG: hypothetical protein ACK5TK_14155 [Betaproteobacteria bacterium]